MTTNGNTEGQGQQGQGMELSELLGMAAGSLDAFSEDLPDIEPITEAEREEIEEAKALLDAEVEEVEAELRAEGIIE